MITVDKPLTRARACKPGKNKQDNILASPSLPLSPFNRGIIALPHTLVAMIMQQSFVYAA